MKKYLKMPLFWSTVILSILCMFFFRAAIIMAGQIDDMEKALNKYSYFYDEKTKDIYVQANGVSSQETASSSTEMSSSEEMTSSSSLTLESSTEKSPALIKTEEIANNMVKMGAVPSSFNHAEATETLQNVRETIENLVANESDRSKGLSLVDTIQGYYDNAKDNNRSLSDIEESLISSAIDTIFGLFK